MVRAGVANLGLDTVGMLLSSGCGSSSLRSSRIGWSRAVGVRPISRGGRRCVGSANDEKLIGGVSIGQRWRRSRSRGLDAAPFRAFAADDVEKDGAVSEEVEEEEEGAAEEESVAASSSQRLHELSSRELSKISRFQQREQRTRAEKQGVPRRPHVLSNLVEEWVTREKGDVRDVVLMSLTFAVLIYISQHLVHAYCTLKHMYFNHY